MALTTGGQRPPFGSSRGRMHACPVVPHGDRPTPTARSPAKKKHMTEISPGTRSKEKQQETKIGPKPRHGCPLVSNSIHYLAFVIPALSPSSPLCFIYSLAFCTEAFLVTSAQLRRVVWSRSPKRFYLLFEFAAQSFSPPSYDSRACLSAHTSHERSLLFISFSNLSFVFALLCVSGS